MNKSIVVKQLKLPEDTIDHICSFIFYTLDKCIQNNKKKYKNTLLDIQQDVRITHVPMHSSTYKTYFMIIEFPVREHKVIYTNICGTCGNFIILTRRKSFSCRCNF